MSLQLLSLSRSCRHNLLTSWGCNRHWAPRCLHSRPPPGTRRGSWRRRSSLSRPPPCRPQLGRTSSWPSGSRIGGTAASWCSDCEVSGSPESKPRDKLRHCHWYNTKTLVKDRRKWFYELCLNCLGWWWYKYTKDCVVCTVCVGNIDYAGIFIPHLSPSRKWEKNGAWAGVATMLFLEN